MHVFHVPSWYPNPTKPYSGVFIEKQINMLAGVEGVRHSVFTWGHSNTCIAVSDPVGSLRKIREHWSRKRISIQEAEALRVTVRKLWWSERIPGGGISQLTPALRQASSLAIERYGPISVVHGHACFPGGVLAKQLAADLGVPLIITEHMGPFPFPNLLEGSDLRLEIRETFEFASRIVTVSESLRKAVKLYTTKRVDVVSNPVQASKSLRAPQEGKFVFLSVGNLITEKGFSVLLDGFSKFLRTMTVGEEKACIIELHIIGDGPERARLERQARKAGVEQNVSFSGSLPHAEVLRYYTSVNCFVLASDHESFGLSYCEALLTGLPVIATDCGGPSSYVNPSNGILIPIRDSAALSDAMNKVYRNYHAYSAEKISNDISERFGVQRYIRRMTDMYAEVISKGHS